MSSGLIASPIFEYYFRFAIERMRVFYRRLEGVPLLVGEPEPYEAWSEDTVLQSYKFTNCYRYLDRISQDCLRRAGRPDLHMEFSQHSRVDLTDPREVFFRVMLYKWFNREEPWTALVQALGEVPSVKSFDVRHYTEILNEHRARGGKIFTSAYMTTGVPTWFCDSSIKHENVFRLLKAWLDAGVPEQLLVAKDQAAAHMCLMYDVERSKRSDTGEKWPMMGDFLAYQYLTDLEYTGVFSWERDTHVWPGPGSARGLRKAFSDLGGQTMSQILTTIWVDQEELFPEWAGEAFPYLRNKNGSPIYLGKIDIQNLFCEFDKWARVAFPEYGGGKPKQRFRQDSRRIPYIFPAGWNVDLRKSLEEARGSLERCATKSS